MKLGSSRRRLRGGIAAIAAGALALGGIIATPIAANAAEADVTGVTFDWGINRESTGGAYFGGCNFLSAGVAGDSGSSRLWTEADGLFASKDGNTTVVKPTANDGTGEKPVTWANKCRLPDETYVAPGAAETTAGRLVQPTSNHALSTTQSRVKIANGSGTVDVAANTAEITWDGSFTVAYYGGMTYWSVTDPKLVVHADGTGTVTALVTGYGADMDDPSIWSKLEDHPDLTLATLTGVEVTSSGFTITPDYLGVEVPADVAGRNDPVTDAAWSGAFPADFLRFQVLTGQSSYWYTTAGGENSIQPRKVTSPLKVSYELPGAVITSQPTAQTVDRGQTATFSVAATDATGYQWQSAPIGSDAFANIDDATSASIEVAGTTANAKQYRVIVTGAAGSVTSNAVTLTVNVPTPTLTVSKTADIDPAGESIRITGQNYEATAEASWAPGVPVGFYAQVGWLDSTWRPSENAPSSARSNAYAAAVQGAKEGDGYIKWTPNADGTANFVWDVTIDKATLDTKKREGATLAVFTVGAGGVKQATNERSVPIAFAIAAPAAPVAPTVAIGTPDTTVDVTWVAPADNGSAITGYDVVLTPASGAAQRASVAGDVLTTSFSGLVRGQSYTATVTAKNAGGPSTASAASAAVTVPALAPAAPAAPSVTAAGTDALNVSWVAPAANGSAITGYTVVVSQGGSVVQTIPVTAPETSTSVTGLDRATSYVVTVAATNGVGTSSASAATTGKTLAEVPAKLAAPTVTAASGTSINVQWVAPADGGSPITGYVVKVRAGGSVVKTVNVGAVTSTTVTGLSTGTSYTATVAAKNAEGTGAASPASDAVKTFAAPSAPVVTAAVDGATGVKATWPAPADNGSAITGYTVQLLADGEPVRTVSTDGTEATFANLTPGAVHTVSVTATNAVGTSTAGVSGEVTVPAVAPSAPSSPVVTPGADGTSVTVGWGAPESDGGSAIVEYQVAIAQVDEQGEVIGEPTIVRLGADARSHTFTGLTAGAFGTSVLAVNGVGSASTDVLLGTLAGPAPTGAPATVPDSALVGESGGDVSIDVADGIATITAGTELANTWIGVTVHSEPTFLGWVLLDGSGNAEVPLPADVSAGTHYVVVQDAAGEVLGYQAFAVDPSTTPGGDTPGTDPSGEGQATAGGALAATGQNGDALGWTLFAALMLIAAGAVVFATRRKVDA